MADQGVRFDYNHGANGATFGANEPFSDKNSSRDWYGQSAAPSGLRSAPYGSAHAAQGGMAGPARLSGSMAVASGYRGHSTGVQDPMRGPASGYAGLSSALPYPERRPGASSDFHRPGSDERMGGFPLPRGHMPDYNKGALSLPRATASGAKAPGLPSTYAFDNQRPSLGHQGRLPASSRKSYEDFEYFEDYENPPELEYMRYEEHEGLNKPEAREEKEDNEDLEDLGESMLNRYVLPSQQDPPSKAGTFPPQSTNEYSRRHTRRSRSPFQPQHSFTERQEYSQRHTRRSRSPFQPRHSSTERLDRPSRSPHSSSQYQSSYPRSWRSGSRSEHPSVSRYKPTQQPRGTRSKSPVIRGRVGSPPRYHSFGRSSRRSPARGRSPLPLEYQLEKQSPEIPDWQKRAVNRSYQGMTGKRRSRSRRHSPSGVRCPNSRSPQSKMNSPWKISNSKTSTNTRSRSPETRATRSRVRSSSRSHTSRNASKSIKGRSSRMSPSKKRSPTNSGKNKSPSRLSSKDRSLQSRHTRTRSPPRYN